MMPIISENLANLLNNLLKIHPKRQQFRKLSNSISYPLPTCRE